MFLRRALVLLFAIPAVPAGAPPPATLTVSAAASLTDALEAVGRQYRESGGGEVRFNFAGSNVLARQILSGAPVDIFVSADAAQMDLVEAAGEVAAGTRTPLLGNRLAVVLSASAPDIADAHGLVHPAIRRIALGNPDAVPAGVYAKTYLQAVGLWDRVSSRIVPVGSVRAALAAVMTGHVDAAVVYRSDVTATSRTRLAFVVSGPHAPPIVYPAAILTRSRNRAAAEQFLRFLRGPQAAALFSRHGFEPLDARR